MEETPPLGEEHYYNCGSKPPTLRLETSMLSCPSRSRTPLDSPDEETSWAHSQLLKGTHWAMTTWENLMNAESVLAELAKMGNAVLSIVGSVPHTCQSKPNIHRHWLIKMSRQVRKSQFPPAILAQCWLAVVTRTGKDTLNEALAKYINYIKGKGGPLIERGVPLLQLIGQRNPNKRTKNEIILYSFTYLR